MRQAGISRPQERNTFYHRKIGRRGGTRSIAVGAILPLDWLLVKIRVASLKGRICLLEITKLD